MNLPQYVTVNGTNYATDKLSQAAREQVANLQIVEEEIRRLNNLLGIAQTAKNVYVGQLIEAMQASKSESSASQPKKAASKTVKAPVVEEKVPATLPKKPRASKKTAP